MGVRDRALREHGESPGLPYFLSLSPPLWYLGGGWPGRSIKGVGSLCFGIFQVSASEELKGSRVVSCGYSPNNDSRPLLFPPQFLRTFRSKSKFERSFETYDTASQVFDVVLLLGDGGGELFDLVGQSDRSGECVPDSFGEAHDQCPLRDFPKAWMRASDCATNAKVRSIDWIAR